MECLYCLVSSSYVASARGFFGRPRDAIELGRLFQVSAELGALRVARVAALPEDPIEDGHRVRFSITMKA